MPNHPCARRSACVSDIWQDLCGAWALCAEFETKICPDLTAMPQLLSMYAPVYRKHASSPIYVLQGFHEMAVTVDARAPVKHVWEALAVFNAPVALFCAGDKTTYMRLQGASELVETWNQKWDVVHGFQDSHGFWCTECTSSLVFCDKGLLCALPVPDYLQGVASIVAGSCMKQALMQHADRQRALYAKLKNNVQFLDLFKGELLGMKRLEGGRVGEKRKRNAVVVQ